MKDFMSILDNSVSPLNEEQWTILKKLLIGLSSIQKVWVSGYMYGLVIASDSKLEPFPNAVSVKDEKGYVSSMSSIFHGITILSASQTGNARKLAKELYQSLINEKFNVRLISVSDYSFKKISQEKLLFLIISTYGEGEPPEEAVMLHKYLFSQNAPNLKGVRFSVFGLGDRTYENFSKASKDFDYRLEKLGAFRIYHRVDADLDYQKEAANWRKEITDLLKKQFMIFNINHITSNCYNSLVDNDVIENSNSTKYSSNKYTKSMPFSACLLVRQKITARGSYKNVYHLEIDISGSGLHYQPGDSLGVWYENDCDLVTELLGYCNFTGKEEVNVDGQMLPCDVVFRKYYELTHNTSLVAKNYASLVNNDELLSLFVDDVKTKNFVSSTSIIDMVRFWPPKKLLPQQLLSVFRPLSPRFYSISSSQQEVGEEVHITVGSVCYEVDGYIRRGGASGYLVHRLLEGEKLQVFIVPNESFRLPKDYNVSVIMIGAGTGIAPFRSFMQQRFVDNAIGKNWLFFGNLSFVDDFLYQKEWQWYFRNGLLTRINTAWSRDQKNKVYVQDKILENGAEVWKWIKDGAYVYVCGEAAHMAAGVEKSLIQLGVEYGKMSFEESNAFLDNMRVLHRYQRDVY